MAREHNERAWHMWHTARLMHWDRRQGQFPKIEKFQRKTLARKEMSPDLQWKVMLRMCG